MAKEPTKTELQEALDKALAENKKLKDNPELLKGILESEAVTSLNSEVESLKLENEQLKKANEETTSKLAKVIKEVPGTFKDKKTGNVYKFKTGFVKFNLKGTIIESVEALKDADLMSKLIEDQFGGIEIVEPSKS